MKTISLPTDTPEQRAIIRALVESSSPRLKYRGKMEPDWTQVSQGDILSVGGYYSFLLVVPDGWLPESTNEESSAAPESTVNQSLTVPECICGFDAGGFRWIKEPAKAKALEDIFIDGMFLTKRHLPSCPCVKKVAVPEIAGEGAAEKPECFHSHQTFGRSGVLQCVQCGAVLSPQTPVTLRNCRKCGQPHGSHTFGPYDTVCPEVPIIERPKKTSEETRFLILNSQIKNIISEIDKLKYPQNAENQPHEADAQKSAECGCDGKLDLDIDDLLDGLDRAREGANIPAHEWYYLMQIAIRLRKIQSHANGGK